MKAFADQMKVIGASVSPKLKAGGFRKRRLTWNRISEHEPDWIEQVGLWQLPSTSVQHGTFRAEFGIYIPEKAIYTGWDKQSEWVNNYDCVFRLISGPKESRSTAWPISTDDETLESVDEAISFGFSAFEKLQSRDDLLSLDDKDRHRTFPTSLVEPPTKILQACIQLQRGEIETARELVKKQIETSDHAGHVKHVTKWATKKGILEP